MKIFSDKTQQWVNNLSHHTIYEFDQMWFEGYSDDIEWVVNENIYWMREESEDFNDLMEELESDEDREEELTEIRQVVQSNLGWSTIQPWMNDLQQLQVTANGTRRGTREAWRLFDDVVESYLKQQPVGPELLDACYGLPDYTGWNQEHRDVEEARLDFVKVLTDFLFSFVDDGYHINGDYCPRTLQNERILKFKEMVS